MNSIKKLQGLFAKFPNIGSRTAGRFVFHILRMPKAGVDEIINAINEVKNKVKLCSFCFNPHEPASSAGGQQESLCSICQNTARNRQILCIVEKEADSISIENSKRYRGLYFILGGVLNIRGSNQDSLRVSELLERVKNPSAFGVNAQVKEIIIATNPTSEGKSTSLLIQRLLKESITNQSFSITQLARGLPMGGELEYADDETLESAFEGRK